VPGLSIHVVDVSRGIVASGMRVEVLFKDRKVLGGVTSAKGALEQSATLEPGVYEALFHVGDWYRTLFHVGDWYRNQNVSLPQVPFLDVVTYRFGISDSSQHYHLPFKCTPWGYSCFRGGA
jgi:5-hydroxyisourate hydrolase